jgi:hypothetical protein
MEIFVADQLGQCIDYGIYSPYGLAFLIVNNYKYISLNEKYNKLSERNNTWGVVTSERYESDRIILFQTGYHCDSEIPFKP